MSALIALDALRDDFRNVYPEWRRARIVRDPDDEPDRLFAPPEDDDALKHFDLLAFEAGQLLSENAEAAKAAGVTEATFNESKPDKRWLLAVFDILGPNVQDWGIDESSDVFTHSALAISRILAVKETKRPEAAAAEGELNRESRALGLARQHPDWTYKKLAAVLGLEDHHVLFKDRVLVDFMRMKKAPPPLPRGSKSKDGNIEAVDDG